MTRGTLSALVGRKGLGVDRLSRRIGFRREGRRQLEVIDEEIGRNLNAFARGVTAGATVGCPRKAHEFTLLRSRPTPYEAADVLGLIKFLSFTLAANWDVEVARLKILREDGPDALKALDPAYPRSIDASTPGDAMAGPALDRLARDLEVFMTAGGGGSNNWAISPARTATGRPIVANDPHLRPSLPPHWYLAHLRTPKWSACGASFVGAPGLPVGHCDTAAWGVTAGLLDNTDLFLEEIGPDGASVRQGGEFVPCQALTEIIEVKGAATEVEEVLVTPRGPIIGPAAESETGAISLRATWLGPKPMKGMLLIHRGRSFEEFRRAWDQWPAGSLNVVYGDTSGAIGWQMVGEAPRRRKGWGTVPLAGRDAEAGWHDEPVPFDEMPHLFDPKTGFVATANNPPHSEGEGPFLGVDWIEGYRQARILEALAARQDWDVAATQSLQMDMMSLPWREVRERVLDVPADSDDIREAIRLLETWDGVLRDDSPAASVFELFLSEMTRRTARARSPRALQRATAQRLSLMVPHSILALRYPGHLIGLLKEQPIGWFARAWPQEMADALATSIKRLREEHGHDTARWGWGRVRPLTLLHPVGRRAPLGRVFNLGPFPWGGDADTISQAAPLPLSATSGPMFIASLRMVADVGNWEDSRFSLPGGQSGNPCSPHYDDLLPLWQRGDERKRFGGIVKYC